MWHKVIYGLILGCLLALSLLLLPGEPARAQRSQPAQEVEVVNFPQVQRVDGRVRVHGSVEVGQPVPAALATTAEVILEPTRGRSPAAMVFAGGIDSSGWRHAVLTLAGEAQGRGGGGAVGAVLIPHTDLASRAFEEERLLFPMEVVAEVEESSLWVSSGQPEVRLGFPRYKVYLYNTSERTVAVTFSAYLTQ